jgi:6,7-dimethyl-8-ribityllumazine synthase
VSQYERWPGEQDDEAELSDPEEAEQADGSALDAFAAPAPEVGEDDEDTGADTDEDFVAGEDGGGVSLLRVDGHAPGMLDLPDGITVLEGSPAGGRRGVGIVASRFNGEITNSLLAAAFAELERAGVTREAITVMPVPGAFELPLGAMALAKTRRYSCIVALGCVIRGETAHFDYVAGEAASGLQLASLETGVPVSFGVLTVDTIEQARARVDKGAEAVRTALEMADIFAQLRAAAQAARG